MNGLLKRVTCSVGNNPTYIQLDFDKKYSNADGERRMYLQVHYQARCTKSGELQWWKGRKWYLSDHMTDNEIIFTCFLAVEIAERHERMETFKVDDYPLLNPHIDYRKLLSLSEDQKNESVRT